MRDIIVVEIHDTLISPESAQRARHSRPETWEPALGTRLSVHSPTSTIDIPASQALAYSIIGASGLFITLPQN